MNPIVSIIRLFQRITSNELGIYPNMSLLSNNLKEALERHTMTLTVDVFTDDVVYMNLEQKMVNSINKEKAIQKLAQEIIENGVYEIKEEKTLTGYKTTYTINFIKDMGF